MIVDMLTKYLTRPSFERLRATVMTDKQVNINDDKYVYQQSDNFRVGEGDGNTYSDIVFVTNYVLFNNMVHPLGAPRL